MNNSIKFKHLVISNLLLLLIVISLLISYRVMAAPNQEPTSSENSTNILSYQGVLLDSNDMPYDGDQNITFRVYSDPNTTSWLWEEAHTGVNAISVHNGLFNTNLGSLVPIPESVWTESDLFLGIQVDSDVEMTPREMINLLPPQIAPGSLDANVLKAGSLERSVLGNYLFYYNANGIVLRNYQLGGLETTLDPAICQTNDVWCCNAENTICLMKASVGDARLALNISETGASCWLAHNDDDHPAYSKGLYYATDRSGGPFGEAATVVFYFSRDGISDIPIRYNATYDIYCFN